MQKMSKEQLANALELWGIMPADYALLILTGEHAKYEEITRDDVASCSVFPRHKLEHDVQVLEALAEVVATAVEVRRRILADHQKSEARA